MASTDRCSESSSQAREYPPWEARQNELKATGISSEGGLNDFESCFYTFKDLPAMLDSSFEEAEAQKFSESYAPVCGLRDLVIRRMLTEHRRSDLSRVSQSCPESPDWFEEGIGPTLP